MKQIFILFFFILISSVICSGQYNEGLLRKAQKGDMDAQMELAKCYLEGNGVNPSEKEAYLWYEKAAEQGNVQAMLECGNILFEDWNYDLEPDIFKGIDWYYKAATRGNKEAKLRLNNMKLPKWEAGKCPFDWLPCDEDLERYEFLKENEAKIKNEYENKNPFASYYMAVIAFKEENYNKAVNYLSDVYLKVIKGDDTFNNFLNIEEDYYINDVEFLTIKVTSLLGWCYEFGIGVESNLLKAAEYYLTDFDYFAFGKPTIPRVRGAYCYKEAKRYDKFIEQVEKQKYGIFDGITGSNNFYVPCLWLELADMYRNGIGLSKDLDAALKIYEQIVDNREHLLSIVMDLPELRDFPSIGHASILASRMYKTGVGCNRDDEMAELYFDLALKFGDRDAWEEYGQKQISNEN